jgi:hypothetical protein
VADATSKQHRTDQRQPELAESRPGGTPTRGKQIQQNWRQPSHTQALSKCGNLPPPEDTHKENGNSRKETSWAHIGSRGRVKNWDVRQPSRHRKPSWTKIRAGRTSWDAETVSGNTVHAWNEMIRVDNLATGIDICRVSNSMGTGMETIFYSRVAPVPDPNQDGYGTNIFFHPILYYRYNSRL